MSVLELLSGQYVRKRFLTQKDDFINFMESHCEKF